MKSDLSDTTFIIPVRVDSVVRLENLILTLELIHQNFITNVIVLESSYYNNGIISSVLKENVSYIFIEDKDPVFCKTKYLNIMARKVKTLITGIWDVDIIVDPKQILDSIEQIRLNKCDVSYPYEGDFYDTSDILRMHYYVNRDIDYLNKNIDKMNKMYALEEVIGAVGGAIFIKTEKYIFSGIENEQFYGWGLEDGERHYRWLGFDYIIHRSKGCVFHLSHPRDSNGVFRSKIHQIKATNEINEIVNYTKEELYMKFS